MASLADKNLSAAAQAEINRITAQAQSGAMSWADANKAANDIRAKEGADYTVSAGGTTTYNDNSTISSLKAGSQTSGGKAQSFVDNWNSNPVSDNAKDYSIIGSPSSFGGVLATVQRNPAYANQSVKMGNYTVTFNELGQAVSARQDGGASATSAVTPTHANDTAYHQAAYQAALAGDWNLAGSYMNKIAELMPKNAYGDADLTAMQNYHQELQNALKYDDKAYYDRLYDQAYGNGSAAVWDATGGKIKTAADWAALTGGMELPQSSAPAIGGSGVTDLNSVYQAMMGGNSAPGMGGSFGSFGSYGTSDMMEYLRNAYAQDLEAQLAALSDSYEQSAAQYRAHDDLIDQTYQAAMNQTAAQNDIQRMYMNEMGIANGLNTGATGQMALGQSAAYQQGIGNLLGQQAQDRAANDLMLAQITSQYQNAVAQAQAQNQAALNQALYQEMIRQEELAYQQYLDYVAQQNYLNELAYQKQQDELNYNLQLMKLEESFNKGRTPGSDEKKAASSVNNGKLSNAQVSALQGLYNVTADGLWGSQSKKAADNMTADQAWSNMLGKVSNVAKGMYTDLNKYYASNTDRLNVIDREYDAGTISDEDYIYLLNSFGML